MSNSRKFTDGPPGRLAHWTALVWLLTVFVCVSSRSAWADGKVFSQVPDTPVAVPDQRAMLYFSNGVERLVIETSFVSQGTNFAWVLPLPSVPQIELVSTNFFSTLSDSFQPRLVTNVPPYWFLFASIGVIMISAGYVKKVGCFPTFLISGSVLFLLLTIVLPTLGPGGCAPATTTVESGAVRVLAQQTVGIYQTTVIGSRDGEELVHWLNSNGFHTPVTALPVIFSYSSNDWVFVTVKIDRANQSTTDVARPHPLSFTFRSERAVYPLRLTGVENARCDIELFVFGPGRAEIDGFKVKHCGTPYASAEKVFSSPRPGEYRIHAPEVLGSAMPAPFATKLIGSLRAEEMWDDAFVRWAPFEPTLHVLHSRAATKTIFLNWLVGIILAGGITLRLIYHKLIAPAEVYLAVGILGLALGCACWQVADIESTTVKTVPFMGSRLYEWDDMNQGLSNYTVFRTNKGVLTFDELVGSFSLNKPSYRVPRNMFTGKPFLNEPTPGNLTLQESGNDMQVLWYDFEGVPYISATFTNAASGGKGAKAGRFEQKETLSENEE